MTPKDASKFSVFLYVLQGLCWYFCVEMGNAFLQKFALFDIFLRKLILILVLAPAFGIILCLIIGLITDLILNYPIKLYEENKKQKLIQLKLKARLKARRKYQKTNQKSGTLNNSINYRANLLYIGCGSPLLDINFLNSFYEIEPRRIGGINLYNVKCMLRDIAYIVLFSLVLYSAALLLGVPFNLLLLLVLALLGFGVAHLLVEFNWFFIVRVIFWVQDNLGMLLALAVSKCSIMLSQFLIIIKGVNR